MPFNIVINDFTGGLNTRDSAKNIANNQATEMTNFVILGEGTLRKRYGYDLLSEGPTASVSPKPRGLLPFNIVGSSPAKYLCIFYDENLYTITPSNSTWVDRGTAYSNAERRVNGTVFNNLAIWGNGAAAPRKFDGTTVSLLGGTPPNFSIFEPDANVLFASGVDASPSEIYWSDKDDPETWGAGVAGSEIIANNDGSQVRALSKHNDQRIVFKDTEKYGINTTASDGSVSIFINEVTDSSDGTVSGNSISKVWDGHYFLGKKGFQKYGITEQNSLRGNPSILSDRIRPTFNKINFGQSDKATSVFKDNRYLCAVPFGTSDINSRVFVYNRRFGAWSLYDNIQPSDFAIFEDADGNEEIYFTSEVEPALYKFNQKFSDVFDETNGGIGINARWFSKQFEPSRKNQFDRITIEGSMTRGAQLKFFVNISDVNGYFNQELFYITDENIIIADAGTGVMGDSIIGETVIGGEVDTEGDDPLFEFFAEIRLPKSLKRGKRIQVGMESSRNREGAGLDEIIISGKRISDKVLKK